VAFVWGRRPGRAIVGQLWGCSLRGRRCTYYRDPESSAQKHGPPPPTCHCESADPKHPQQGPPITSQPSPPDPVGRAMPGDALAMVCAHQDVPLGRGHIAGRELPLEAVVHLVGQPPEPVAATKRPHSQRIRRITSPLPRRPSPRRGVLSREGEPGRSLVNHSEPNHRPDPDGQLRQPTFTPRWRIRPVRERAGLSRERRGLRLPRPGRAGHRHLAGRT